MTKTTLYLDEDLAISLRQLSAQQGRPQAEIIRDALHTYTAQHGRRPLPPGVGQFDSGRTDLSTNVEHILKDASKGKHKWR